MALLEPTNLLLLACALIYGLIGEPQEAWILLGFVVAICLLDGWQQQRSRRALAELARLSSPRARVRREGIDLELAPEEVRVGDLLRLEEGDRVAADAQLREGVGLWMDASLLTGESLPNAVEAAGELIRAGSLVASGRGLAEVVAVGEATELGRLGRSLATVTPPPTRLQRHTRRLTARLSLLALALCAGLAVVQGSLSGDWSTALLAALALALAVLPNEIPVVVAAGRLPPRARPRRSSSFATSPRSALPRCCRLPTNWLPRVCGCWRWPAAWMGRPATLTCRRQRRWAARRRTCTTTCLSRSAWWGWRIRCGRKCRPQSPWPEGQGCGW